MHLLFDNRFNKISLSFFYAEKELFDFFIPD